MAVREVRPPQPSIDVETASKGSRTKQQLQVEERLRELGCDLIEGMARIAMDETMPIEVRARMYAELAQYIAPKRKAVEHSLAANSTAFVMIGARPDDTAEEWEQRNNPDQKVKLQ